MLCKLALGQLPPRLTKAEALRKVAARGAIATGPLLEAGRTVPFTREAASQSFASPPFDMPAMKNHELPAALSHVAAEATTLIPVQMSQGTLAAAGVPILSDVCSTSFISTSVAGNAGLVLGLRTAQGQATALEEVSLGRLHCRRWLASSRIKLYWMAPAWGQRADQLPPETQFLIVELSAGGPYAMVLPLLSEGKFRATLRPDRRKPAVHDKLRLRVESGVESVTASEWDTAVLVAAGSDPFELVEAAVAAAARLSGGAKPRAVKEMPRVLDLFGWCTWDAFYSKVSAQGVGEGLSALRAGGINPKFVVIDDGWQRTAPPTADPPGTEQPLRKAVRKQAKIEAERKLLLSHAKAQRPKQSGSGTALSELANEASVTEPRRKPFSSSASLTGLSRKVEPISEADTDEGLKDEPVAVTEMREPTAVSVEVRLVSDAAPKDGAKGAKAGKQKGNPPADAASLPLTLCWGDFQGKLKGAFAVTLAMLYTRLIEHAPQASMRIRLFNSLVQGSLRKAMLDFYDNTSDHTRRMTSILANSKFGSPTSGPEEPSQGAEGLRGVVSELKGKHGVEQVLCWHSLQGYWAGLAQSLTGAEEEQSLPVDVIYPKPSAGVLEVDPCFAWNCQVLSGVGVTGDVRQLYSQMHTYLAGAGVDGVKVDCQSTLDMMGGAPNQHGASAMSGEYHAALESSVEHHFPGNAIINCMCHSTNDLYRMADTVLVRSSDDFWPRDPASHTTHVAVNAFNSLFLAPLLQPDWDMFHSLHPAALLHATARVVSGGPIYVSDRPGCHDFELLRRLVQPDGTVLRCQGPGRPTADSLFCDVMHDNTSLLKVWNMNACGAVVAAFNLQGASWDRDRRQYLTHNAKPPTLESSLRLQDVAPLQRATGAERYVVWTDSQQQAMEIAADGMIPITLGPGQSELLTIQPLTRLGDSAWVGPIGLVNMLNAGAALQAVSFTPASKAAPQGTISMTLRGAGTLLVYSTAEPLACLLNGSPVGHHYDSTSKLVTVEVPQVADLMNSVALHV